MSEDAMKLLKAQFDAVPGSFLDLLRTEFIWDKDEYAKLLKAMVQIAEEFTNIELLPRWLSFGFWYIPDFVRTWTTHPSWENYINADKEYFDRARQRLYDVAYWFFVGKSIYKDQDKNLDAII